MPIWVPHTLLFLLARVGFGSTPKGPGLTPAKVRRHNHNSLLRLQFHALHPHNASLHLQHRPNRPAAPCHTQPLQHFLHLARPAGVAQPNPVPRPPVAQRRHPAGTSRALLLRRRRPNFDPHPNPKHRRHNLSRNRPRIFRNRFCLPPPKPPPPSAEALAAFAPPAAPWPVPVSARRGPGAPASGAPQSTENPAPHPTAPPHTAAAFAATPAPALPTGHIQSQPIPSSTPPTPHRLPPIRTAAPPEPVQPATRPLRPAQARPSAPGVPSIADSTLPAMAAAHAGCGCG
jgi:hypothetical protein